MTLAARARWVCAAMVATAVAAGTVPVTTPVIATTAGTAQVAPARLITIETPSRYVDPTKIVFNGPTRPLLAKVLLPRGYLEQPTRRWPVLYLLHGVTDGFDTWATLGDIGHTAADFPGIIVMPEGARGFYTDWWQGGRRGDPGWERFFLDELIPQVEQRFRILPGRRWHAIAGVSMGGLGAAYLAGQAPAYFGSVATFSGFMNPDRPEVAIAFRAVVPEASFLDVWGPPGGFYAIGHDPTQIPENLANTRLWVTSGDGISEPVAGDLPINIITRGPIELVVIVPHVQAFLHAMRGVGADLTWVPHHGIHEWSYYWRRALREAIAWDLFAPVEDNPMQWTYTTTAGHGAAWHIGYRFPAPPRGLVRFTRDGAVLRIDGPAGYVDLRDSNGCWSRRRIPSAGPIDPVTPDCRPGGGPVASLPRDVPGNRAPWRTDN
jgi:S-formylglutathione hydrolase FrmB